MTNAIYRSVDHLWIRLSEVEPLYRFLTHTLGLPVAWPLQRSGTASVAWVTLGNVNLELWATEQSAGYPETLQTPIFCGIALDCADFKQSVHQLTRLGVPCKLLRPYQTRNEHGEAVAKVTNAVLMNLSSETCSIFLSEWTPIAAVAPWHEKLSVAERQQRDQEALEDCAGGALGLLGLAEIELETDDFDTALKEWRLLSGSTARPLQLAEDLVLRLVPGRTTQILSVTLAVYSLALAKEFLAANQCVGDARADEIILSERVTGGLQIRIVERQSMVSLDWPELASA